MRRSIAIIVLIILSFVSGADRLYAQEDKKNSIEFLPQQVMDQVGGEVAEFHYIGGQKVVIPFWVYTSDNRTLILTAEATQLGYSLQAPYGIKAEITPASDEKNSVVRHLSLMLPEVKRETNFEVVLKRNEKENPEDLGRFKMVVYPQDMLKPLKQWAKEHQVRLKDRQWILAEVFEKNEIEFVDDRAALPKTKERPVVTIIVGEPEEDFLEKPPGFWEGSIIILREGYSSIPKVTVRPIKTGTLVDVELEVVKDLTQNPRHQKAFLDIVRLTKTFNAQEDRR